MTRFFPAMLLMFGLGSLHAQAPRTRADETLEWWNHIGEKLIRYAKDFPEDKYDFKPQKDERTFAENLLHVASVDFDVASKVSGRQIGPDFGDEGHSPARRHYPTKADVGGCWNKRSRPARL